MDIIFHDKERVKIKIKNHVGFNHDFNAEKKKTVTTIFLRSSQSFRFAIHVFSCYDYDLSSHKCKLSIKNLYHLIAENMLQTTLISFWILLQKYICCCNTAAKWTQFNFAAVFQQRFFMLQTAKVSLELCGATCNFFLAFSIQHIAF